MIRKELKNDTKTAKLQLQRLELFILLRDLIHEIQHYLSAQIPATLLDSQQEVVVEEEEHQADVSLKHHLIIEYYLKIQVTVDRQPF